MEQLNKIRSELQDIDNKIAYMLDKVSSLQTGENSNNVSIDEISNKLISLQTRVGNLEINVTNFNKSMADLQTEFTTLQSNDTIQDSNIIALQGIVSDIQNSLDFVSTDVSTNTRNLASLSESVASLETAVNNIETQIEQINIALENLPTGSGSSSEELEALQQQVNNNVSNITVLQNDISNLQSQINLLTPATDPDYIGETFTDYPEGTIFTLSDNYELDLNLTTCGSVNTPSVFFCAEAGSVGTIKVTLEFNVQLIATNCLFQLLLNDVIIDEKTVEITQIDNTYRVEFLATKDLNAEEKGNKIDVICALNGTESNTRQLNVTYLKVEISAPNADIISKVYPFDVLFSNNTYYVSDCRTGVAQFAQIVPNNMVNINSLTWNESNMHALNCQIIQKLEEYSDNYAFVDIAYLLTKNNNEIEYISNTEGEANHIFDKRCVCANWLPMQSNNVGFNSAMYSINYAYYNYTNKTTLYIAGSTVVSKIVNVYCPKYLFEINTNILYKSFIAQNINGECILYFQHKSNKNINLGYCSNLTFYIENYVSYNNADFVVYMNYFGEIIKKVAHYNGSTFTLTETTKIGRYSKFFKMPNNDYFVIKNNQLLYYKNT